MRRIAPDLVLTYTIKPNIWGAFAAHGLGIRSAAMVTGLGYAFTGSAGRNPLRRGLRGLIRRLYRGATDRNHVVIFQNTDDLDDFRAAGCLGDVQKARLVNGSGVDLRHYAPAPLPEQPVFLMISRLLGNKGVREYCAAALSVKQQHPEARFLLAGYMDGGPDSVGGDELAAWQNNGVEYLGGLSDVRPALAEASVYVLPSYREGTPRSVLEAMATGRAVITTDAPGCRETVTEGYNGFLVPVKDVEKLAAAMRQMVENPGLRRQMGGNSLDLVQKKFDVVKVNETLLAHLDL